MGYPKILDCTFRDGGYTCDWNYTDDQFRDWYLACAESKIDLCEIGFRRGLEDSKFGKWYFCTPELIKSVVLPVKEEAIQKFGFAPKIAVMSQIGTVKIEDFEDLTGIDTVRILMAYHSGFNEENERDDSIFDYRTFEEGISLMENIKCEDITFNLGRIDKVLPEQLRYVCYRLNTTKIKAMYIADTYGNLTIDSSKPILKLLRDNLSENINLGYHAHDNLGNATAKTIEAFSSGLVDYIDGTMFGVGRGSGNAKLELLVAEYYPSKLLSIFSYIEKWVSQYKNTRPDHGYNLMYIISGIYSMHVNYAIEMIEKHNFSIQEAYEILLKIVEDKRHNFYDSRLITNYSHHR